MFTGIIETTGIIGNISARANYKIITIGPKNPLSPLAPGDSVSVDGCCLTVVRSADREFAVEVSPESLAVTIIGDYKNGTAVNLERALLPTVRLGGHLVTGHIDSTGTIQEIRKEADILELSINYPEEFSNLLVTKGSIALNGISLTVNSIKGNSFSTNLIPHTRNITTVGMLKEGDKINLEFDIIGKYIAKFMTRKNGSNLTVDKLINSGW